MSQASAFTISNRDVKQELRPASRAGLNGLELSMPRVFASASLPMSSPNVTDHRAATIDLPSRTRPTSPLRCIGLFSASVWR